MRETRETQARRPVVGSGHEHAIGWADRPFLVWVGTTLGEYVGLCALCGAAVTRRGEVAGWDGGARLSAPPPTQSREVVDHDR